jgi:uncharacterized membrane protein
MISLEGARKHEPAGSARRGGRFDMEMLVGYILLAGVLGSMLLIAAGILWHWLATRQLGFQYTITGMNLYQFVVTDLRQAVRGDFRPRLVANFGIIILMMTPYLRVFASMVYFAAVERNWKYALFTAFVFSVLTYSLFIR